MLSIRGPTRWYRLLQASMLNGAVILFHEYFVGKQTNGRKSVLLSIRRLNLSLMERRYIYALFLKLIVLEISFEEKNKMSFTYYFLKLIFLMNNSHSLLHCCVKFYRYVAYWCRR